MKLGRLSQLNTREKLFLSLAALLVLFLLADRLVLRTVSNVLTRFDGRIQEQKNKLLYNLSATQVADQIAREYEQAGDLLQETTTPARAVDELSDQVNTLADGARVRLKSIGPQEPVVGDHIHEYAVEIREFEADLRDLFSFLYAVTRAPGLLRVTNLELGPTRDKSLATGSMRITKVMRAPAPEG
jgi:hypothetical protein